MTRSKVTETCKLQINIDSATDRLIGEIAALGIQGSNKSEVGRSILRMWLWENQEKLRLSGVEINPKANISMQGKEWPGRGI